MSELPIGWVETTIGEVAPYVSRGRSPKYADRSDLPVINQKAVRWLGIEEQHLKFVDPTTWHQWDADRFVRRGDVLWNSTGTGTIGRATIFTGLPSFDRAVVDSHVTIVRPGPAVEPRYLFSFIRSPTVQDQIADMQSGSTNQVELNRAVIVSTTIPLPPLLEQQRIVAKLYALLNQTAHARAGLDRIPTLIGKYKESLLTAAFSGDLTREWRELTGLSEPRTVTLDDLCSSITDGDHQAPPRVEKGIPFITIAAMNDGQIQIDKATRYVPKSYADSLKPDRRPRPGDVL